MVRRSRTTTRQLSVVIVVGMFALLAIRALQQYRSHAGGRGPTVRSAHNAAQTWAWEDDEVVFEGACECGWLGPDRATQTEAVTDALEHLR